MNLTDYEFSVLRHTIATRGTIRIVIAPVTLMAWAALTLVLMLFSELPVTTLLPLAVLAGGFEAIHALHAGVERIGRYLQVFYEERTADGPRWETTAMRAGPALPGGGVDPLFTILFLFASVLNMLPALLPQPTPIEIAVLGALHAAFVSRVIAARAAAAKQRGVELERFRAVRGSERPG